MEVNHFLWKSLEFQTTPGDPSYQMTITRNGSSETTDVPNIAFYGLEKTKPTSRADMMKYVCSRFKNNVPVVVVKPGLGLRALIFVNPKVVNIQSSRWQGINGEAIASLTLEDHRTIFGKKYVGQEEWSNVIDDPTYPAFLSCAHVSFNEKAIVEGIIEENTPFHLEVSPIKQR